MKVAIVAPNASAMMGGEAFLPLRYFLHLKEAGVGVKLITHERVRAELLDHYSEFQDCFAFAKDSFLEKAVYGIGALFPGVVRQYTFDPFVSLIGLIRLRKLVRRLALEGDIDVVHQPTPISPRFPSPISRVGAPVVIGPLNGGMSYPPAFQSRYEGFSSVVLRLARCSSGILNRIFPGKLEAQCLLVASQRIVGALPSGTERVPKSVIPENGVDLAFWDSTPDRVLPEVPTFIFVGRLIDLKAVDFLIEAFFATPMKARLWIVGDGPKRHLLEQYANSFSDERKSVLFLGHQSQAGIRALFRQATALMMPSLRECSSTVVLEAMASRLAVIATRWGGHVDYISADAGILVEPAGSREFVAGLANAMVRLASDRGQAIAMGDCGRRHIEGEFDWPIKAIHVLSVYKDAIAAYKQAAHQEADGAAFVKASSPRKLGSRI
jgi:glycosyltransferase involved in cell wall biosynthesis